MLEPRISNGYIADVRHARPPGGARLEDRSAQAVQHNSVLHSVPAPAHNERTAMPLATTACQALVLDTNILVGAGFNRHSDSARLVDAVREGRLRMVWNDATRSEAEHILRRIPPLSWDSFATLFRDSDRFQGTASPDEFDYVDDPADRKFAALADAANVLLVTNDAGLLEALARTSVRALRPGEFVRHC